MKKRVVVTGIGVVLENSHNIDDFWALISKGHSFVSQLELENPEISCKIASQVKNFNLDYGILSKKEQKRTDKTIHWALHTVNQALNQSKINLEEINPYHIGNLVGTGFGGFMSLVKHHEKYTLDKKLSSFPAYSLTQSLNSMIPAYISIKNKLKGMSYSVSSACASSAHAFEISLKEIQNGTHKIMVCTGVESAIADVGILNFVNLKALTTQYNDNPTKASRPFDQNRSGFVMGEGSATLILEEYEHAINRGAPILAEVLSAESSSDAKYLVAPDETSESIQECMKRAINNANIKPEDIDYINAHATSTIIGDQYESHAIEKIFKNNKNLNISATKSMTGHLLGGSGALELVISILSMLNNTVPPTINLDTPDDNCKLNYTPNKSEKKTLIMF
jgi:3-oxoacyl-[acyl-carrier-protein] synthase II